MLQNPTKTELAEKLYDTLCDEDLINLAGYADEENPDRLKNLFIETFKEQFKDFTLVYTASIIEE